MGHFYLSRCVFFHSLLYSIPTQYTEKTKERKRIRHGHLLRQRNRHTLSCRFPKKLADEALRANPRIAMTAVSRQGESANPFASSGAFFIRLFGVTYDVDDPVGIEECAKNYQSKIQLCQTDREIRVSLLTALGARIRIF